MNVYASRLNELLRLIEEKLKEIPYIDKIMAIKGIGLVTVADREKCGVRGNTQLF